MYRAYDRHLYERAPAVPARTLTHPDSRTVVHPLLFCPPLPRGTRYMLVQREWPGMRNVLAVGRAQSAHETVKLADIRRIAAQLGANEVHVLP
jgi:hypothetical protein